MRRDPARFCSLKGSSASFRLAAALVPLLAACTSHSPSPAPAGASLARAESLYANLRALRDRIDVTVAAGRHKTVEGLPLSSLVIGYSRVWDTLAPRLAAIDSTAFEPEDRRALNIMRRNLARDLNPYVSALVPEGALDQRRPDCTYDARAIAAGTNGLDSLRARLYACYGWTQSHLVVDGDTVDRLSILGALGRTESSDVRRRLFLGLEPVWRSVNRDNGPGSPYRQLIAREVRERANAEPPAAEQARASGVPPDSLERWLLRVLETWRKVTPDSLIEPWDWFYQMGLTSRRLSPLIPLDRLTSLNRQVYRSLGADIGALGVRYDLEPREGKTPVAYCTFGGRPRLINGSWRSGEPWVFATYRTGGLDNLNELLHETGHAVHIAAIRSRPAFSDWPDSDPFTEAVADFVALEVYEPTWQQHWLGDSVPRSEGLRSRYGGIVLDVAWALFEMQMQRDPGADPNQVWTTLTSSYLRILPHPELSWWAMRGQLVDAPGYMMNYAAGSILIAAIRARTRAVHGPFVTGDSTWYSWVVPRLYRFGLERPTREVIEEFLGGPVSPQPLLEDMLRIIRS
jgi:hypothetical protein